MHAQGWQLKYLKLRSLLLKPMPVERIFKLNPHLPKKLFLFASMKAP